MTTTVVSDYRYLMCFDGELVELYDRAGLATYADAREAWERRATGRIPAETREAVDA